MTVSFANHQALQGLDSEQIAELALFGLRYRALGAGSTDFADASRLDVYWTGKRLVEKAVDDAIKAAKARGPLADSKYGIAQGNLSALLNCGLIDDETYMTQYRLLSDQA